jgi:SAM-dependent methyltransferase
VGETGSNRVARESLDAEASARASRRWWDSDAVRYRAEHGDFLGDDRPDGALVWGPEGADEASLGLLGPLAGRRVLEVGAGSAQCSRWVAAQGGLALALDLSVGMLTAGGGAQLPVPRLAADARRLPVRDHSVDVAFSAYGALPFVADPERVLAEVARVLRPGGRWAFSVTHPVRWAFPDDPGPRGLTAVRPYFDRTPYVERDEQGVPAYVEHHRTLGDWVRLLVAAGFEVVDLVEPEWPDGQEQVWGAWSPLRGRFLPGTAIWVTDLRSPT